MQAGDRFELVTQNDNALYEYTLLPAARHAMLPVEKKATVEIVKNLTTTRGEMSAAVS